MEISLLLMQQIAQLFLILIMGYAVVKVGLLKASDSRVLSVVMVYLVTPCVIINAFTSFDEEMKGAEPVQSTFLVDMDKLFDAALAVPEISGIILNPWNRTIQLDKTLIRIIKGA